MSARPVLRLKAPSPRFQPATEGRGGPGKAPETTQELRKPEPLVVADPETVAGLLERLERALEQQATALTPTSRRTAATRAKGLRQKLRGLGVTDPPTRTVTGAR
jgi:hypothetical protein